MTNARLSDKELANINAAAVTKEYRIKPHLGVLLMLLTAIQASHLLGALTDYRTVSAING
jgi:hypothetical protein